MKSLSENQNNLMEALRKQELVMNPICKDYAPNFLLATDEFIQLIKSEKTEGETVYVAQLLIEHHTPIPLFCCMDRDKSDVLMKALRFGWEVMEREKSILSAGTSATTFIDDHDSALTNRQIKHCLRGVLGTVYICSVTGRDIRFRLTKI